jgi:hypothetical protein
VAKAVDHEHRLGLTEQLTRGPHSVEALAEWVGCSLDNAFPHMRQFRRTAVAARVPKHARSNRIVAAGATQR